MSARFAFLAASVVSAGLFGQSFTGQISVLVTDPSGAVISGALVTITDLQRNTTTKSISNETGLFLITQLQPGTYSLVAEHPGFRRWVLGEMPLTRSSPFLKGCRGVE